LHDSSIIVFDDWFQFHGNPTLGEQRTFYEWQGHHRDWLVTEFQKEGPFRVSFVRSQMDERVVWRAADRGERIWWMAVTLSIVAYALTADRGAAWATWISRAWHNQSSMRSATVCFATFFLADAGETTADCRLGNGHPFLNPAD
jgi:hypothetical protein